MASKGEHIEDLEEELRTTKYNKATQHHIGRVKAKIARLKDELQTSGSGTKKGEGYSIRKSGHATVSMIGFPSVGKSTLLNALTNAESKVAAYDFTTLDVIPGTLEYNHADIQIWDVPGIVHGAASGRGRGREVLAAVRAADLLLVVLDVHHPGHNKVLQNEILEAGLRLNVKKPDVKLTKKERGGCSISSTVKQPHVDAGTLKAILEEYRILNVDVVLRSVITVDDFIDVLEGNRIYIPGITVMNKMDAISPEKLEQVMRATGADICISAKDGINIEPLKQMIFDRLDIICIYLKQIGKKPDMDEPLIMKRGCTVEDVCLKLHRDFVSKFKFARSWGTSARFPGQRRMLHHQLHDKDILEIHLT